MKLTLNARISLLLLLLVPLVSAAVYFSLRDQVNLPNADDSGEISIRDQTVIVGGVARPASDVRASWRGRTARDGDTEWQSVPPERPRAAALKPDTNPTVRAVYDAAVSQQNPEQLSPVVMPEPFDRDAYAQDPEAYLALHEPGRIWQSAQPGEGVTVLERIGRRAQTIRQGEAVRLKVKTEPNMPVTFMTFDLGVFENGLAAMSVAADQSGEAEAVFQGTGVVGEVNILAASPVAAERVRFRVYVVSGAP